MQRDPDAEMSWGGWGYLEVVVGVKLCNGNIHGVYGVMVILANFLDFVNFPLFCDFFRLAFLGGAGGAAPLCIRACFIVIRVLILQRRSLRRRLFLFTHFILFYFILYFLCVYFNSNAKAVQFVNKWVQKSDLV